MKCKIIIYFLLVHTFQLYSQTWPKIYGRNANTWPHDMIEAYDKGYLLELQVDQNSLNPKMYALLIKTDINGLPLWSKSLFSTNYAIGFNGIDKTADGGFIVTGVSTILDPANFDIVFSKFNACGEKEWCKVVSTPGNDDYGIKIRQIGTGYIALVSYFQDWTTKRIWLFKLDMDGNILWEVLINESTIDLQNGEGSDLLILPSNENIVTGDAYELVGNVHLLRPLIIKTDSLANIEWTLPFGHTNGFWGGYATNSRVTAGGSYYTAATHIRDTVPFGRAPSLLKISATGEEMYFFDLVQNSLSGGSTTLDLQNNDSLFISAIWYDEYNIGKVGFFKTDTLGNIGITKILYQNIPYGSYNIYNTLLTASGDYVADGAFQFDSTYSQIYLFKFRSNLEDALFDSVPRVYDSLCPHAIVSDTTNLDDCDVVTSIADPVLSPDLFRMTISPNPASTIIAIKMPQELLRKFPAGPFTISSIYHQWSSVRLEIYDISGRLEYSAAVPKSTPFVNLDVSSWSNGLYVARLVYLNDQVANTKFMVRR
jgi:hypothetical protein